MLKTIVCKRILPALILIILFAPAILALDYNQMYNDYKSQFQWQSSSYGTLNSALSNCKLSIQLGDINAACFAQLETYQSKNIKSLENSLKTLASDLTNLKQDYLNSGGNLNDKLSTDITSLQADVNAKIEATLNLDSEMLIFLNTQRLAHDQTLVADYHSDYASLNTNLDSAIQSKNKNSVSNLIAQMNDLLNKLNNIKTGIISICSQTNLDQCTSAKKDSSELASSIASSISQGQSFLDSTNQPAQNNSSQEQNNTNQNQENSSSNDNSTGSTNTNSNNSPGFSFDANSGSSNTDKQHSTNIYSPDEDARTASSSETGLFNFKPGTKDNSLAIVTELNKNKLPTGSLSLLFYLILVAFVLLILRGYFKLRGALRN